MVRRLRVVDCYGGATAIGDLIRHALATRLVEHAHADRILAVGDFNGNVMHCNGVVETAVGGLGSADANQTTATVRVYATTPSQPTAFSGRHPFFIDGAVLLEAIPDEAVLLETTPKWGVDCHVTCHLTTSED